MKDILQYEGRNIRRTWNNDEWYFCIADIISIKDLKKKDNLRDNMTYLELGFNIIGEASTLNEIADHDPHGFDENNECAKRGGENAGAARKAYEEKSGNKVVSSWNFKKYLKGGKDDEKK